MKAPLPIKSIQCPWWSSLQAEPGHHQVLGLVPGLEVRRVRLVLRLGDEGHGQVLDVVPVQALEQRVAPQL